MENNLIGSLTIFKIMEIKPNFSELARTFGKDRHTIKKIYDGKEVKVRAKKPSELDQYADDIAEVLSHNGANIKGTFWYFQNEKEIKCSYDNFKTYVRKNQLFKKAKQSTPHPLFETDPGEQLQIDWVEDIKLLTTSGEIIEFNLFSATLGYSRLHYFEFTEFKTEADFKRCLIHYFKKIGGITKQVLTDNMTAIVNINGNVKTIHRSIIQFFNDLGVKLRLCKTRTPETKGKDETSNKFAQWLRSYDGKIEDKNHLLRIIDKLNIDINRQKNASTLIPPAILFQKEKEYLSPLPNNEILNFYENEMHYCKVPSTFLINYKGAKYSVPPYLITKTVWYKETNGKLCIYYKKELVAEHEIKNKHSINYIEDHYKQGLIGKLKNDDEIEALTMKNLAKFKDFGEK